ncbi:MAG: DUF1345 domain-containing protein [Dongiaceae bacterium]
MPARSAAPRKRHLPRRPRLLLTVAVGIAAWLLLPAAMGPVTRLLAAFDLAAAIFTVALWRMMAGATPGEMQRRARLEEEGRHVILALSVAVASALLAAIVSQLHGAKGEPPTQAGLHVGLAALTIVLAWGFMNTMFALHYAHEYYGEGDDGVIGGLRFPGGAEPDYWDFLYFSFVVGMTFQVSDVTIESGRVRRVALAHGVLAFLFNVTILALTINIVAGLI